MKTRRDSIASLSRAAENAAHDRRHAPTTLEVGRAMKKAMALGKEYALKGRKPLALEERVRKLARAEAQGYFSELWESAKWNYDHAKVMKKLHADPQRKVKIAAGKKAIASAALRQRYAEALQENARLKSPRRAPLGPVRRLPGGENHRHGPGPRRCPKCGV